MIPVKTEEDVSHIRKSVEILVSAFHEIEKTLAPGITTLKLDEVVEETIRSKGGSPAFKGYRGFPASVCVSIDKEVVHGIPGPRMIREGELVSIDIGVELDGFFSDAAKTYGVGDVSSENKELMEATHTALVKGIEECCDGNRLSDVSHAIQTHVESKGFSVVKALVGHGIGKELHEEPQIPNYGLPHRGPVLEAGMVFAIEPMVNTGESNVDFLDDGWTVVTSDGLPSAHFEHMVLLTEDKPEILTIGIENN